MRRCKYCGSEGVDMVSNRITPETICKRCWDNSNSSNYDYGRCNVCGKPEGTTTDGEPVPGNCDCGTSSRKKKKDCFITTATLISLQKPDDCNELNAFRKFRDTYMSQNKPELIAEYYQIAPQIVASIDVRSSKEDIYKKLWENELSKCLSHIENGENLEAMERYQAMVLTLKSQFLK